jgi:hypothetical protein
VQSLYDRPRAAIKQNTFFNKTAMRKQIRSRFAHHSRSAQIKKARTASAKTQKKEQNG